MKILERGLTREAGWKRLIKDALIERAVMTIRGDSERLLESQSAVPEIQS